MDIVFKPADFAPDFYERLGIDRKATPRDIRLAYIKRSKETHPNTNPDNPDAEALFIGIKQAEEILMNSVKKIAYDLQLSKLKPEESFDDPKKPGDNDLLFRHFATQGGDLPKLRLTVQVLFGLPVDGKGLKEPQAIKHTPFPTPEL